MNSRPPPTETRLVDDDADPNERTWALAMHLSVLAATILVPVVPALILWLVKRESSPFLNDHGKEAVNFQLSLVLYFIVGVLATAVTCGLAAIALSVIPIFGVVCAVIASVAANRGEFYRYPATIRFIT